MFKESEKNMERFENLLATYKTQIIPRRKDFFELQNWIVQNLDVEEMPLTDFSNAFIKQLILSAKNAITNSECQLSESQFQFISYRLKKTAKNCIYNADLRNSGNTFIYIIVERNTGFISTNNAKLHLELTVEQGISQIDYDSNSDYLLYYVRCIERLLKNEY